MPIVAGAVPSNTAQWVPGKLFKNQLGNLGPSLGFAWDPFADRQDLHPQQLPHRL